MNRLLKASAAIAVLTLLVACANHSGIEASTSGDTTTPPQSRGTAAATQSESASRDRRAVTVELGGKEIAIDGPIICSETMIGGGRDIAEESQGRVSNTFVVGLDAQGNVISTALNFDNGQMSYSYLKENAGRDNIGLGDASLTRNGNQVHVVGHMSLGATGALEPFVFDITCP